MARYPPSLRISFSVFIAPLSSCSSRSSWSNIQQQYTSAERHISRGGEQGADRDVSCAEMAPVRSLGMPCRPGIEGTRQVSYPMFNTPYICSARNCQQIRNVSFASSATAIAAWNRVRLVNARRGPGLLDLEGSGLPISQLGRHGPREGGWGWGVWWMHENTQMSRWCWRRLDWT